MISVKPTGNPTKDTSNLEKALARGFGQWIMLKAGTFLVQRTLVPQQFTRISGEVMGVPAAAAGQPDYGTVLRCAPGFPGPIMQSPSVGNDGYWDRSMLEHIAFDGGPEYPKYGLVLSNPGERFLCSCCSFTRFAQAGVWIQGGAALARFSDCFFAYCKAYFFQNTPHLRNHGGGGNIWFTSCSGDDPGIAALGFNTVAFVTWQDGKSEYPMTTFGSAFPYGNMLVDWHTDAIDGQAPEVARSPQLLILGGTANMQATGIVIHCGPPVATGLNLRAEWVRFAVQGGAKMVVDTVNGKEVLNPGDGGSGTYIPL